MRKQQKIAKRQKIARIKQRRTLQRTSTPKTAMNKLLVAGNDKLPLYTAAEKRTKIALVQTGSWGDNINSTLMLKPLKAHYKDCLIDVYTSSYYASAFYNNKYIDHIIKYMATDKQSALHLTCTIPPTIEKRGYDKVFAPHPMFNPGNWTSIKHPEFGTNLICAWIRALEHANIPYSLPLETSLRLTEQEVQRVSSFCKKVKHQKGMRNVLMEVHGESGQTFWDHNWTLATGKHLLGDENTNLFISRRHNSSDVEELQKFAPGRVYFVGNLSIRECAELFNRCQVFFSVSSGLSNACNTDWCKNDITWVETTNSDSVTSVPIRKSGKIFWHQNNRKTFLAMLQSNQI